MTTPAEALRALPDPYPITPVRGPIVGTVRVPGSKSFTNRALPVAALAHGESVLTGVLESEDTILMMDALRSLGVTIEHDPTKSQALIRGVGGPFPARQANVFLGNSGTSMRFLTALIAAGQGTFVLDGVARMRERPIKDLLDSLSQLHVDARCLLSPDCPPIEIRARGLRGGAVSIRGDVSSQFLSGLLLAGPLTEIGLEIRVDGPLVSQPYVDMTLAVMKDFGVATERKGYEFFRIQGQADGSYLGRTYEIEPDASAASYFFAIAAITGGSITLPGLGSESLQGDWRFVDALERMGCRVDRSPRSTTIHGAPLHGIDIDMGDISDTVPTLAVVAALAEGATQIRNVAHIRHKETDRISAVVNELRRAGILVEEHPDGLTIHPGPLRPAIFDTYDDHRMAMSFALLGLRHQDMAVRNPACVGKTYPRYFEHLSHLARP